MAYLLDTSVAILLRDGDVAITDRIAALDGAVLMSIVTRVELEGGVYRETTHAAVRRARLDTIMAAIPALAFDDAAADAYGSIVAHTGDSRRKLIDRMIAAQALVHRATLVTLNEGDFRDIPELQVEAW
jgi:tRNA(fMet)-specific endonuclease VapC